MTPDTSVVVAAFARWHERHTDASTTLKDCTTLASHVAMETYSVLTRLPAGHRVPATDVERLLLTHFPDAWITLDAKEVTTLLAHCVAGGVEGGAVYDALVGATATENEHRLVTLDRRAASTYRAVGADTLLL